MTQARCFVTTEEYHKFRQTFFARSVPDGQRYGQAFYNHFSTTRQIRDDLPWPELFYKRDINEAEKLIQAEVFKFEQEQN